MKRCCEGHDPRKTVSQPWLLARCHGADQMPEGLVHWLECDIPASRCEALLGWWRPSDAAAQLPQPEQQGDRLPNGTAGHADLGSPGAQHHGDHRGTDLRQAAALQLHASRVRPPAAA
jgi:hypothetical protein